MPKDKEINDLIKDLESRFGKDILKQADRLTHKKLPRLSTGIISLDVDLGGGLPRSRVIEIYGQESSGKTYLSLVTAARVTLNKKRVAWLDAEGVWDGEWVLAIGADPKFIDLARPESAEVALDVLEALVMSGKYDLIVLDSVAALAPMEELEKSTEEWQMGLMARLMNKTCRKVHSALNKIPDDEEGPVVILINQLRQKIGVVWGNPNVTPGGRGIKFATSVRIEIAKVDFVKIKEEIVGQKSKYLTKKNKTAPPQKIGTFDFYMIDTKYGKKGRVDNILELLGLCLWLGLVDKVGSWFKFHSQYKIRVKYQKSKLRAKLSAEPKLVFQLVKDISRLTNIKLDVNNYLWNGAGK